MFRVISVILLISFHINAQVYPDNPEILTPAEKVELLWISHLNGELEPVSFFTKLQSLEHSNLGARDRLRIAQMRSNFKKDKGIFSIDNVSSEEALKIVSEFDLYKNISVAFDELSQSNLKQAQKKLQRLLQFKAKTKKEITQLVYHTPEATEFKNGEYAQSARLFLFCRKNRSYPCRFVLKDMFNRVVRNDDGTIWSMPALAKSAANFPSYKTNGHTPEGVHTIDSVMPTANRQLEFGKFRRVILNWIPNDEQTKTLLPKISKTSNWWKAASLARDNGRKWLRIHGTGRVNRLPLSKYYPHMPTAGCVSVREGTYRGVEYIDQRHVLDALMEAVSLDPVFSNEVNVKGLLYVVVLDNKKGSVSLETLKDYGIQ
ncbi:MAG: hypothetical protein KC478_07505 [Bacteriovoracaceae bacterium]|nr:hypothetical protein [Bacteriovoracaceae bacterium]